VLSNRGGTRRRWYGYNYICFMPTDA
jgi:hypothetical protein